MNILIAIATAAVVLWAFYHLATRKVIIDAQRFKIFALRDQVRMMAAAGEIPSDSFSFQYIECLLCFLVKNCGMITVSKFVESCIQARGIEEPLESKRFNENGLEELKLIAGKASRHFLLSMFANSPSFFLFFLVIVLIADAVGRLRSGWDKWMQTNVRIFVEQRVFSNGMPCLGE